jgi:hypothetical protein
VSPGDVIKIKSPDGTKWRGRVIRIDTMSDPIGPPGQQVHGRMSTELRVVLEGPWRK